MKNGRSAPCAIHVLFLFPCCSFFLGQPSADNLDDMLLLLRRKCPPLGNLVPLLQASPATGARGVLRNEYGMVVPGRLLPIIDRLCKRQSFFDEAPGVLEDFPHPFLAEVFEFLLLQVDLTAKPGLLEMQ